MSHELTVCSWNKNGSETIHFIEGEFDKRSCENIIDKKTPSGTCVTFKPSKEFFQHAEPNEKELKALFDDLCGLCPKLHIHFNGQEFYHPEGLKYLVKKSIGKDEPIVSDTCFIQKKQDKYDFTCGITYSSKSFTKMTAYVNYGLTDAGPHITAIKSTITRILNKWAREQGLLKEKDKNLDGASLQEGLVLVFNLIAPNISYDAQTKSRIVNNDFVPFLNEVVSDKLEYWLDSNPEDGKAILDKALLARKAAEAAKKARENVKKKAAKKDKVFKLPTSLTDCWNKDRSCCELMVTEGLSAATNIVASRDSKFQAVYPVRGKMISAQKVTPKRLYQNQEVNNLIQALGLDCNPKTCKLTYDKNKLRYDKIIATADAN